MAHILPTSAPRVRYLAIAVALALMSLPLPAATPRMPLAEVRAGMQGVGFTVFDGTTRAAFDVHVLGVLTNAMGPRRSLIVARLEGGPLATTGVIQGMSGSPVYIDDRLVGAVSYSLGTFSTEAIAGITPIEEMVATDAVPRAAGRQRPAPLALAPPGTALTAAVHRAFAPLQAMADPGGGSTTGTFARRPRDVRPRDASSAADRRLGALLRPIATPLVLGGVVPEVHDLWAAAFDGLGFATTIGGAAPVSGTQTAGGPSPLEPGDPVGAALMTGDMTMVGTGTVTLVDGGRVYAFGHPFYNLGHAQFPMTRAQVTTLLPSRAISSRLASIGDVIGTIDQDRATGIYGTLGPGPSMIAVTVSLTASDRDLDERFEFEIVDDPLLTPLLTYTGVLNTFFSWTRQVGVSTYDVAGTVRLRHHDDIAFRDVFAGPNAGIIAALSTAAPATTLLGNPFEPVTIEGLDLTIVSREEPRLATVQRVSVDNVRPRAGESVSVAIGLRTVDGEDIVHTLDVPLPRHVTGTVQLLVADAATLRQRAAQPGRDARSLRQVIQRLGAARQNDRLYVQLLSAQPGAVVGGAQLAGLPPSVLAVLEGDREHGTVAPLPQAALGEWEVPTGHVVSGTRLVTLTLEAP